MSAPNPLFLREEELDRGLDLLYRAGQQAGADARELLAEARLDEGEHRLLLAIERRPGSTLAELALNLGQSKQTLSRQLKALIERCLVELSAASTDRRKRPLRLAPQASELLLRIKALQKRRLRAAFRSAGAVAVEGFALVLDELVGESDKARPRARPR